MTYTYHCYSKCQQDNGLICEIETIATWGKPIKTQQDYENLKALIVEERKLDPDNLIICSLTLIHTEK